MHLGCNVIIFLGPPGSGKGTQAGWLSNYLRIPTISTGEMLRQEIRSGSPIGQAVGNVLASGQLVGDPLMNEVLTNRLGQPDCRSGFILDGYPRTASQAVFLDRLLAEHDLPDLHVIDLQVSAEEVLQRLSMRRQCPSCGRISSVKDGSAWQLTCALDGSTLVVRSDDEPSVICERLRLYSKISEELSSYYHGRNYHRVNAARSPGEISGELASILSPVHYRPVRSRKTAAFAAAAV